MLPNINKAHNPGRPIVNGIESITQKVSTFIDEHIRPTVPKILSYVKDTSTSYHYLWDTDNMLKIYYLQKM